MFAIRRADQLSLRLPVFQFLPSFTTQRHQRRWAYTSNSCFFIPSFFVQLQDLTHTRLSVRHPGQFVTRSNSLFPSSSENFSLWTSGSLVSVLCLGIIVTKKNTRKTVADNCKNWVWRDSANFDLSLLVLYNYFEVGMFRKAGGWEKGTSCFGALLPVLVGFGITYSGNPHASPVFPGDWTPFWTPIRASFFKQACSQICPLLYDTRLCCLRYIRSYAFENRIF